MTKKKAKETDPRKEILQRLRDLKHDVDRTEDMPRRLPRELARGISDLERITAERHKTPVQQKKDATKQLEQQRQDALEKIADYEAMPISDDRDNYIQNWKKRLQELDDQLEVLGLEGAEQ